MKKLFCMFLFLLWLVDLHASDQVLYELDFKDARGDVEAWFGQRGWEFREDVDEMNLRFEKGRLIFEPQSDLLGVISIEFPPQQFLQDAEWLQIEWGVEQYPLGADWSGPKDQDRNTREALGLMVFFGERTIESGSIFVPNLPYFLAFFLGETENPNQVYYGNYWQEGGRYFCIPCDGRIHKTFITKVNLKQLLQQHLQQKDLPITGLSLEVDVQDTQAQNGRHSKAFIQKFQILGP